MQLNPMDYNNTTEKVKMVRAPASTARRPTSKTNLKEVTEKTTKKTKDGQTLTCYYIITRNLKVTIEIDTEKLSNYQNIGSHKTTKR